MNEKGRLAPSFDAKRPRATDKTARAIRHGWSSIARMTCVRRTGLVLYRANGLNYPGKQENTTRTAHRCRKRPEKGSIVGHATFSGERLRFTGRITGRSAARDVQEHVGHPRSTMITMQADTNTTTIATRSPTIPHHLEVTPVAQ